MLTRRIEPVNKATRPLDTLNVIAKISFAGKLHLRTDDARSGYKGPLFEAHAGDLVISKIRVGQGSFCVIDKEFGQIAVSPEYPVYAPSPGVSPRFLALVLRTSGFMRQLAASAGGNTTKRRIRVSFFERLQVPLPPLAEQEAIVAAYEAALAQADAADAAASAAEAAAATAFAAALGAAPLAPPPDRPVFITSFKDLDRWSHDALQRRATSVPDAAPAWPVVRLGDVIADLENGWSPQCLDRPAKPGEWGVLKVSAASSGLFREQENKALPAHLKPRPALQVRAGDVLITRANGAANLVGVAAYVEDTTGSLMLCDKLFRVVMPPVARVDATFLAFSLRLPSVRSQIKGEFSTNSGMMKNVSKPALLTLSFPLPPLNIQQTLVSALKAGQAEAARLRAEATAKRAAAWTAFEAAL